MSANVARSGIVLATAVLSIASFHFSFFDAWQEQLTDRFFIRSDSPQDIIIIAADEESLRAFGQWPWPRSVFADILTKINDAKQIGIDIDFSEPSRIGSADDTALAEAFRNNTTPVVLPVELDEDSRVQTRPLPLFENITNQGFVNVVLSSDGILRSLSSTRTTNEGDIYKSFSASLAGEDVNTAPEIMRIAYRGPAQTMLTISASDVLSGAIPEDFFEDSYVLIGATAQSLRDFFKTPFGIIPGVEVHANALDTIVHKRYLNDLSAPIVWSLIIILSSLAGMMVIVIKRFGLLMLALISSVGLLGLVSLAVFSFGVVVPLLYALISFIFSSASMLAFEYIVGSKEKRFIRDSFSHYLAPSVVQEIINHPEKLALGGEKKHMTILFSDIRSFTTISESLSPEALTQFMNEYLSEMTNIIMAHDGLVDKYIGDAIMAFWGAPIDDDKQEEKAVSATRAMLAKLDDLNNTWATRGIPSIAIGVGVSSGDVVVGNMGSSQRFDYTVMGDVVNFASRIEGLTKKYGISCLVSESVFCKLSKEKVQCVRELDEVYVKGKEETRKIYELRTELLSKEAQTAFMQAHDAYRTGNWDEAIFLFEKAELAGDKVACVFRKRCESFKQNPPHNWTGFYRHDSK